MVITGDCEIYLSEQTLPTQITVPSQRFENRDMSFLFDVYFSFEM